LSRRVRYLINYLLDFYVVTSSYCIEHIERF